VASLPEKETPLGDGSLSSDTDVSFTYFQKQFMWLLIADCQSRFLVTQKHLLNICRGLLIVTLSIAVIMRALPCMKLASTRSLEFIYLLQFSIFCCIADFLTADFKLRSKPCKLLKIFLDMLQFSFVK
jgi:hypothetical protein